MAWRLKDNMYAKEKEELAKELQRREDVADGISSGSAAGSAKVATTKKKAARKRFMRISYHYLPMAYSALKPRK